MSSEHSPDVGDPWVPSSDEMVAEMTDEEKLDFINRARRRKTLRLLGQLPKPRPLPKGAGALLGAGLLGAAVGSLLSSPSGAKAAREVLDSVSQPVTTPTKKKP